MKPGNIMCFVINPNSMCVKVDFHLCVWHAQFYSFAFPQKSFPVRCPSFSRKLNRKSDDNQSNIKFC